MSKPTIEQTVTGYAFAWEEGININVSRLKTHSDGRVTGQIHITLDVEGMAPHLHRAQFNFVATRTRKELQRVLEDKYPSVNWYDILEQLCYHILEKLRTGEPVEELLASDQAEPPEFLIRPLVIRGYPNLLFGDPSSGKSTLAVILAQMMMLPWYDNPLSLSVPQTVTRCLYLDWESDNVTLRWLTTLFARGLGVGELSLLYRRCSGPLADNIDEIRTHVDENDADVLIIDSLGLAAGGELNAPEPALAFYAALRAINCTSIVLAHNAKPPSDGKRVLLRTIFGSMFFTALARNIWEVTKVQTLNSPEYDIQLTHRKPAPFSRLYPPIGAHIHYFDEDDPNHARLTVSPLNVNDIPEFREKRDWSTRILLALREDGPLTPNELTEILDGNAHTVRGALKRLKAQRKVVELENHMYGLAIQMDASIPLPGDEK